MSQVASICDYLGVTPQEHCGGDDRPASAPRDRRDLLDSSLVINYDDIDMTDCKVVGRGAVGMVVRARWQNKDVAVKMLRDFVVDRSLKGTRAARAKADFNQEMYIVSQQLRHPNLVQALGICSNESLSCMIVFEYVHGGSLDDVLFKKKRFGQAFRPGKKLALSWCKQLASSLEFLHSRKPCIIHRDVKPSNILITHDMKTLKLTDLGLATSRTDDENRQMTGLTGTTCFMAPEVYKSEGSYTELVDVYSAGMVMWCIGTGLMPSEGKDETIFTALSSFGITPDLSRVRPSGLRSILTSAWALNPRDRPSASELVQRLDVLLAEKSKGKITKLINSVSTKIFRRQKRASGGDEANSDLDSTIPSSMYSSDYLDGTIQSSMTSSTDIESISPSRITGDATESADVTEISGEPTTWLEEAGARTPP